MIHIRRCPKWAVLAALLSAACRGRYEYVPPVCPDVSTPRLTSAIAWQGVGASHAIIGRVLNVSDAIPIQGAVVRVRPDGRARATDSVGLVRFDSVAAGTESLFVIAMSHSPISARVTVPVDSGIAFIAAMESQGPRMTDGCGFVLMRRKKPWWKFW
jgi:hypothetical protein